MFHISKTGQTPRILDVLCSLGYSSIKRGDHYEVVNNRSLRSVDPGPMSQEDAERQADKLNTRAKYRMMDEMRKLGHV